MTDKNQTIMLNVIQHTVEKYGCHIVNVDLEQQRIEIDGPPEVVAECAHALVKLLD